MYFLLSPYYIFCFLILLPFIYNIYSIQYGRPISLPYIRRHSLLTAFPYSAQSLPPFSPSPVPRSPALRTLTFPYLPLPKANKNLLKSP